MKIQDIQTKYGTVDIRQGVPKGFKCISIEKILGSLGIDFAPALIGFIKHDVASDYKSDYIPKFSGVVISEKDVETLVATNTNLSNTLFDNEEQNRLNNFIEIESVLSKKQKRYMKFLNNLFSLIKNQQCDTIIAELNNFISLEYQYKL